MDRNRCYIEARPNLTQIANGVQSASLRLSNREREYAQAAWPIRATRVAHRCLWPVPFAPLSRYRIRVMMDRMTAQSRCHIGWVNALCGVP
jgi:hypothetical protein